MAVPTTGMEKRVLSNEKYEETFSNKYVLISK
jgi:hypothetical protein